MVNSIIQSLRWNMLGIESIGKLYIQSLRWNVLGIESNGQQEVQDNTISYH